MNVESRGQFWHTDKKRFWIVFLLLFAIYFSFASFHHVSTRYNDTNIDYQDYQRVNTSLLGDEPHYLIIVRSIVEHKTLNLTQTYLELNYPKDTWQIGPEGFSGHGLGLPLLLLVPFVLAGTFGAIVFMCAVTAIVGTEVFGLSYKIHGNARYALISTIIFGAIFLLPFSSQIYPDMVAALIAIVVVRKIFVEPQWKTQSLTLTGALIGFSLLLNPKFIVLFAVPLGYVAFMLLIRREGRAFAAFAIPFLSFLLVYCYYTWYYFGSIFFSPYTASYILAPAPFSLSSSGLLGLLIDREHGVFAYFPALYLIFFGLAASMKKLGRNVVWVVIMCAMFYALVAFSTYWKGATTAGREILPIIVLSAAPFSTAFVIFWRKTYFKILASTLIVVTAGFSFAISWNKLWGFFGFLYDVLRSVLRTNVGSFWPIFWHPFCSWQWWDCPLSFRIYDYVFVTLFVVYTILITVLAGKSTMMPVSHNPHGAEQS